ncbi:uncharacterized protein LOC111682211 [Lucilia cuprina]|uniref:uncharacterized protein LOC111682211 n=1 Tax=Lucilia cuprina TaxID=7375 RepID=UPI001F06FE30|nr:uncharacterized protein LOC111682211 [Lucilia cuprina]
MATLKGFRFICFITALVGITGLTLYPIVIKPLINVDDYKQLRRLHHWKDQKKT